KAGGTHNLRQQEQGDTPMIPFPSFRIIKKRIRRALASAPSPEAEIRRLQKLNPPQYDRTDSLLPALRRCLPAEVDALFRYGTAWAGEIGLPDVNVQVRT